MGGLTSWTSQIDLVTCPWSWNSLTSFGLWNTSAEICAAFWAPDFLCGAFGWLWSATRWSHSFYTVGLWGSWFTIIDIILTRLTEAALQFAVGKRRQMLKDAEAEAVIGWARACWWRWCQPVPFPGVYWRRIHRRLHRQAIVGSVDSSLEHALAVVGAPWVTTRLALQCHEMSRFHPGSRADLVVEQPRWAAEESFAALCWGKADSLAAVAGS